MYIEAIYMTYYYMHVYVDTLYSISYEKLCIVVPPADLGWLYLSPPLLPLKL